MAIPLRSAGSRHHGKSRFARWIILLIASLLLHVAALNWADGRIGWPSAQESPKAVIMTTLKTAEPPAPPKPAKPKAAPVKPKPRPKPRPAPPPPAPVPPVANSEAAMPPADIEAPGTGTEPATGAEPIELPADSAPYPPPYADALASQEQPESYKVDPPPSAELHYDVEALREGRPAYGHGNINWQRNGDSYTINGDAGALIFTFLSFRSEGLIDGFGVAPVLYAEKRFRRPETNTHFHRERNTISFSASTLSYPRKGGEQDRASVVWQLAGIGRGDSGKFAPGAEIDVMVAGVRDAETWHMRVIGEEEIELKSGKVTAWHVVRLPRAGSYDQRLDLWLAPGYEWYPVKLRYTETNGDYLDMSLSNLNSISAH